LGGGRCDESGSQRKDSSKESRQRKRQRQWNSRSARLTRQYGKGAIMKLGADAMLARSLLFRRGRCPWISPWAWWLPKGRVVEIFGPEASGKTTLALHAVAEIQKKGGVAAFIDAEHALDVHYAKKLGVKTDDLLISQPDTGEQALEIAEILIRSNGAST